MDDEFLQTLDFVAFDTETTGLWAAANRIIEIGAIKFRLGSLECRSFSSLVNPERPIPAEAVAVHGITDPMVRDADKAPAVLADFFEFCGPDSILLAHNALFDISFLGAELNRAGMPIPENIVLDTVDIYRTMFPGEASYSLLALARRFGVARDQNHRAADDAAIVWKLFHQASEKFPYVKSLSGLTRKFQKYSIAQWQGETRDLPEEYDLIRRAIEEERRLEIVYQSDARPPLARVIRPFQVHWHRQMYYILAHCEHADGERMFRLDRVKSFRLAD